MKDAIEKAMGFAKKLGADYADIRIKDIQTERIAAEDGQIIDLSLSRSRGAGIRVYVNGAMGFAAASNVDDLSSTVQLAYDTAIASSELLRDKAVLSPKEAVSGEYSTEIKIDPFAVPTADKIALLMSANDNMAKIDGLTHYGASIDFRCEDVIFGDSDGSYISQKFYQSGGGVYAIADSQKRSYGNILRAGYEAIEGFKLAERSVDIAKEAVALSEAEDCPAGEFDLLIMPSQMHLQIHESVGHPTELDRVLGSEAAFAGASFLSPKDIGSGLKYGSEHISIVADAVNARNDLGLGNFGYDDEGVPAQNIRLIDKGIFANFQSSRDNATVVGQNSHGMGISDGWANLPIVRMTNISLEPGDFTLDELISGVDEGFLLETNKSWSIDDKRINFQFACELAREIKGGKLTGKIFKNPIYTGSTTEFWGSCDGVASSEFREMIGVPNCGKGQPMQLMRCGHASSPARFRKVRTLKNG
jgi:TldD protein